MGLKSYLQSRRDDAELGKGIWRRSHDRFIRGIDRFHQVLERLAGTESSASMIELIVPDANELADLIPRVRAVAMEAHRLAPPTSTAPSPRPATPWPSAPRLWPWPAASASAPPDATAR